MAKITRLLFDVSQQGNPICKIWLDDADTTKTSEAKILGIRSQVAYVFFLTKGSLVETKESKGYTNIVSAEQFINMFENYKVLTHKIPEVQEALRFSGWCFNNAFNNFVESLEFHKNGEVTILSKEEFIDGANTFLSEEVHLEDVVIDFMLSKENKSKYNKKIFKALEKDDAKPLELQVAHDQALKYADKLSYKYISKNNLRMESQ